MATKPTPGGSDGTYGTELNAFLDESLASDGKIKDGAVFTTSAAPTVDAGVSNKLYADSIPNDGAAAFLVNSSAAPTTFTDLDIDNLASIGSQKTLVTIVVANASGSTADYSFRTNGGTVTLAIIAIPDGDRHQVAIPTDASGIIEWKASTTATSSIFLVSFIKLKP